MMSGDRRRPKTVEETETIRFTPETGNPEAHDYLDYVEYLERMRVGGADDENALRRRPGARRTAARRRSS
jgi:hypothetical protein